MADEWEGGKHNERGSKAGKGIKYKPIYMISRWQPYWVRWSNSSLEQRVTFFVPVLAVWLEYPIARCDLDANILLLEAFTVEPVS